MVSNRPYLVDYKPIEGGVAPLDPEIWLYWSRPVLEEQFSNPAQLNSIVKLYPASNTASGIGLSFESYSAGSNLVKLSTTETLTAGEKYSIVIQTGVEDSLGERTSNRSYHWTFTASGISISPPANLNPVDSSIVSGFPGFSWSSVVGATGYVFQLASSPSFSTPLFNTNTTLLTISPSGSFDENQTYYWRVRAVTASGLGLWSDIYSFWYGDRENVHSSSRVSWEPDSFDILQSSLESTPSNVQAFPEISITLTSTPASSYSDYLTLTKTGVSTRNDQASSSINTEVSGSWSLSGNKLTFTPSEDIVSNTLYVLTVDKDLTSTAGRTLGETIELGFTGPYTPMYTSARAVKAILASLLDDFPDDFVNHHIYLASLDANIKYDSYMRVGGFQNSEQVTESVVRSYDLKSHPVSRWVAVKAAARIVQSVIFEDMRSVGKTIQIADYTKRVTQDFLEAAKMALDELKDELLFWDDVVTGGEGGIEWAERSCRWSWQNLDFDWQVVSAERNYGYRSRF